MSFPRAVLAPEACEKKKLKALFTLNLLYLVRELKSRLCWTPQYNTQIDTFNFNSVLFHLCIYLCFILLDGTAVIEAESENHPPASVMRQWCRGRRQNGRGKLRKVRVWLSEGWTGPFFSKQEAASLCLERRGISLRKTQMRSLVGTDTRDGGGKL